MSIIKLEANNDTIRVINDLVYPESINANQLNAVNSGTIKGVLPLNVCQTPTRLALECCANGLVPLSAIFSRPVVRFVFFDIITKIINVIKNCEAAGANPVFLDVCSERMFINPADGELFCVYWPLTNSCAENPPYKFFRNFPLSVNFDTTEDLGYVNDYLGYFKNAAVPFTVNGFEDFILNLQASSADPVAFDPVVEESPAVDTAPPIEEFTPVNVHPIVEEAPVVEMPPVSEPAPVVSSDNSGEYCYCHECGTKNDGDYFFCIECGTKLIPATPASEPVSEPMPEPVPEPAPEPIYEPAQEPVPAPVYEEPIPEPIPAPMPAPDPEPYIESVVYEPQPEYIAESDDDEATMLLVEEPEVTIDIPRPAARPQAAVMRLRTGEKAFIDKPLFRIGKERRNCDFVVTENTAISRKHIDIITRGDKYYIIDLASTNGTYLDGVAVPPQREIEIRPETRIGLADEIFVFFLESSDGGAV